MLRPTNWAWAGTSGVTTREDVQIRLREDIERHGIRVIVRRDHTSGFRVAPSLVGSTLLATWLAEHFEPLERHGRYEIWLRRR